MPFVLTVSVTVGAGLLLLALLKSRTKSGDVAPDEHGPTEERATENADTLAIERRPVQSAGVRIPVGPSEWKFPCAWALRRRRALVASVKYGYFAYVLYSDIDQSGLAGWIASLSMRLFHASWDIPNVLLSWALYFLCASLFRRGLRFARPEMDFSSATREPAPRPRRSAMQVSTPVWIGVGTGIALLIGCIGAVAGAMAFRAWTIDEQRQAVAPPLNLDSFSRTPPASPRVELKGWFHERLTAQYETAFAPSRVTVSSSGGIMGADHAFTPVTSADWKRGEPLSVLLEHSEEAPVTDRLLLGRSIHWKPGQDPASLVRQWAGDGASPPLITTRNVRLRANDLPFFVKDAYERAGIHFTDPYWVAYTDYDERPFVFVLVGALLVVFLGLPFVAARLAKRVRGPRAG